MERAAAAAMRQIIDLNASLGNCRADAGEYGDAPAAGARPEWLRRCCSLRLAAAAATMACRRRSWLPCLLPPSRPRRRQPASPVDASLPLVAVAILLRGRHYCTQSPRSLRTPPALLPPWPTCHCAAAVSARHHTCRAAASHAAPRCHYTEFWIRLAWRLPFLLQHKINPISYLDLICTPV